MLRDDSAPLPYGALGYYQLHFVVDCHDNDTSRFFAKCEPITKGWLSSKKVIDVRWTGLDAFPEALQNDSKLTEMLKEILLFESEIRVDPVGNLVRIYGKWHNDYETKFNRTMAEVADRISMHIKSMTGTAVEDIPK